jgi:hypothetical protein
MLLLVQLADFVFLPMKLGHIKCLLNRAKPAWKKYPYTSAMVVFGHVTISLLLMVVMFKAFGFHGDMAVAMAGGLSTLKELILWFRVGYRLEAEVNLSWYKNLFADAGLLTYSILAFTLAWEPLAANSSIMPDWGNWIVFGMTLMIVTAVTSVFLLTLRIPYLVEEWSGHVDGKSKVIFFASFLLLLSGAIAPYFDGEVDFDTAIANQGQVRKLYLERKGLTEIPSEVWEMRSLQILDLGQNRISVIPRKIANLVNLEVLRIDHNPIDFLPREVSDLPRLRELDIRSTGLWSKTIEDYEGLQRLEVRW